jgi:hypothetical protein
MDKAAQKAADMLSSTPVIILFGIWAIYHTITTREYVSAISDITFLAALLILRDEKIQGEKAERILKEADRASKKDLKQTEEVKTMIKYLMGQYKL